METWYYAVGGEKKGPIDERTLKDLARAGVLSPSDLVSTDRETDWKAASTVPGLFGSEPPPLPSRTVSPPLPANPPRPKPVFQFDPAKPRLPLTPTVPAVARSRMNPDAKAAATSPHIGTLAAAASASRPLSDIRPTIPKRRSSKRWILLVAGLALVGIVAVGIPQWHRTYLQNNENSAYARLISYPAAQEIYRNVCYKEDGVPKYAQSLRELFTAKPDLMLIDKKFVDAEGPAGDSIPFAGYLFKVLKAQGRCAQDGKRSYVVNGNMILGYALIAYPADYDHTGIDSFIVSQDGTVFQKDLGPETISAVDAMTDFNPDPTWVPSGPALEIKRQNIDLEEFLKPRSNVTANTPINLPAVQLPRKARPFPRTDDISPQSQSQPQPQPQIAPQRDPDIAAQQRQRAEALAALQRELQQIDPSVAAMDRELQDTYTRAQNLRKQMYNANDRMKQTLDRQHAELVAKVDQLKSKMEDLRKRKAELIALIEQAKNP